MSPLNHYTSKSSSFYLRLDEKTLLSHSTSGLILQCGLFAINTCIAAPSFSAASMYHPRNVQESYYVILSPELAEMLATRA